MHRGNFLVLGLMLWFISCKPSSNADYTAESRAEYHMRIADSLEAATALPEASLEYKLVAELYPKTSHYPNAVRNTALLYSNPTNPAVDDSLALQWFQTYLRLSISREEKVKAEIYVTMLKRLTKLRKEIHRQSATTDSLLSVTRRQSSELASRNKKVQELESELKKTTFELEKLREVDVRINRRRVGK